MFLEKLMPDRGLYCVAILQPKYGSFRHIFHESLTTAANQIETLSRAGHNVYLAQATFDPQKIYAAQAFKKSPEYNYERDHLLPQAKERSHSNAVLLKNFFLDIDCGEKWPLKTQKEGCQALAQFVKDTGLPMPTVMNSGNGLYAHWILQKAIPTPQWQTVAKVLKQVVASYSPKVGGDASRTSDAASVLRPPGTVNRKPGKLEKPVVLIHEAPEVDFLTFAKLLGSAAKKKKVDVTKLRAPKPSDDINAEFLVRQESVPSDPNQVAEKCNQLAIMRDAKGDIIEPLWYCCLGLLSFCEGGEEIAHAWSSGHIEYSYGQTEKKLQQWADSGMGPTTCTKFGEVNPNGCLGCPNNGQIKSPIVLGRPEPEQIALPDEQCPPPSGFRRADDGLFVEKDGRWIKFYDQDLWIHQLAWDESLAYEVMVVRHKLPHEGEMECTLRSALVHDPKTLLITLADNHIKVVGKAEKNIMVAYMESYQQVLQRNRRMNLLLCQMGWKDDRSGKGPMFVLGRRIFHSDGTVDEANLAKNVPRAAHGFKSVGDLAPWIKMTSVFRMPGMEAHAFAFLAGAFGSVLLKFTGFEGAVVSMHGPSGCGKTLVLRMINSVWGYHKDLIMLKDDTRNTILSRLGVYANLPMTLDEVTNMTGSEVSDFAYRITQGRDKGRLNANAVEKTNLNSWNTLAVTTSNASLIDLLSTAKADPSAEINRILEYEVRPHPRFKDEVTTGVYWSLDENYGLAGEVYAKWLVQNTDKIKPALSEIRERIEKVASIRGDERFWSAVASVATVGGLFAKKLGLIDFEIAPIFTWITNTIGNMRSCKTDLSTSAVDILGQFLAEHAHNRLVVTRVKGQGRLWHILDEPRGQLTVRIEASEKLLFISRSQMKQWIGKRFGSYNSAKHDLLANGIIIDANAQKNLGAGTNYIGANQPCWKIDIAAESLAGVNKDMLLSLSTLNDNLECL